MNILKTIFRVFNYKFLIVILIFLIGWYSNVVYSTMNGLQNPLSTNSPEIHSPTDRIKNENLKLYTDGLYLNLKNLELASYADTNSMDPFLDKGATGIEIKPTSEDEINLGDIIAFETNNELIVHRVVKIGEDDTGKYFITKGDNNNQNDGIKVRFDKIKYVLVGILY